MKTKLVIIGICLVFTICGYFVNSESVTSSERKEITLDQDLGPITGWKLVKKHELLDVVAETLDLDDYMNQTFTNGKDFISLYIGYYYSSKKVGAAHDPMVCFPGQGWQIENSSKGTIAVSDSIKTPFEYSVMVANLREETELIAYWFQAYDEPASSTLSQKIKLAKKKLTGKKEDNAFVRISTSCKSKDFDKCRQVVLNFVDNFYPSFLKFVTTDSF